MAADKLNIKFRVQAFDNFSTTLNRLEDKLESIKREARGANFKVVADVDLDKTKFDLKYYEVLGDMMDLPEKHTINIDVDGYETTIAKLQHIQKEVKPTNNLYFNLKATDKFSKAFDKLDRRILASRLLLQELNSEKIEFNFDSNIVETLKGIKKMPKEIKKVKKEVPVEIGVTFLWKDFKRQIDRMADLSRDTGELIRHHLVGSLVSAIPMLSPAIASMGAVLGSLLPIVGTLSGGIFGISTAFGVAGIGAVAMGALMSSAIGDVFEASSDLAELQKELANTTDLEERAKILEKIADIQAGMNKEQKRALASLDELKATWEGISSALEPQTVNVFSTAMEGLNKALETLSPMFGSVVTHAERLADYLNMQVDSEDMKAFFDFLNKSAGPAMETIGTALFEFAMGLANMMTAFGPFATEMQDGFLEMGKSFREWAAGLSESDRFLGFIDYVRENLPKLKTIFGNVVDGLVGMGEAFAPFTADMLDGLVEMTDKFEQWGKTLGDNQGFKNFIAYVKENGPLVLDFIGGMTTFLINLGKAFSVVGTFMLKFHNGMLEWYNGMMETSPGLAKLVAGVVAFGAVILTHLPILLMMRTGVRMLTPIMKILWMAISKMLPLFGRFGSVILRVLPFILNMGRVISLLAMGPIGLLVGAVVALAIIIYKNWDKIKEWTTTMGKKVFESIARLVAKVITKFNGLKDSIMGAISGINLFESGKKIVGSLIKGVTSMAGSVGKAIGKVTSRLRDYLPFSPAKRGALRDLNKLNFGGPIVDSLQADKSQVTKAMGNMLNVPAVKANGYSMTNAQARSAGMAPGNTSGALPQAQNSAEYYFEVPVVIDGREVARATAKFTEEELSRMKRNKTRASGRVSLV